MSPTDTSTDVVIIGGGVSGLSLALYLRIQGVPCVVLERNSRQHVEVRQRAGMVDARGIEMFERWGVADKLMGGDFVHTVEYRLNGVGRIFEVKDLKGRANRFCTQQMLVNNLLTEYIDERGGLIRFDVTDVSIVNDLDKPPTATFTDVNGQRSITAKHIVGCDGNRGISRSSIPPGTLTKYSHEYGYAWLAALVEAPLQGPALMAMSDHGFTSRIPRGPQRSRVYLQCLVSDGPEDWPARRIFDEYRLRSGDQALQDAPVLSKEVVSMRSVMFSPLQYRNLYLAGDAAHLVPPTGAKGMNLALFDIDLLGQALVQATKSGDPARLKTYSSDVLPTLWRYQEFSAWMTETMHDGGDPSLNGSFKQAIARARIEELFHSPEMGRQHSDLMLGFA